MSEDSTRPKRRQVGKRTESAQIIAFPNRRFVTAASEPDHIMITLMADGTHDLRVVGQYAETIELAAVALGLALDRVEPLIAPRAGQIISFPERRSA